LAQIPTIARQKGPYKTPWIKRLETASLGEAVGILENVTMFGSRGPLISERLRTSFREEAMTNIARFSETEVSASCGN